MAHAINQEALIAPCQALLRIFQEARAKEDAHAGSRELLAGLAENPRFLTAALQRHLEKPGNLMLRHYPVIPLLIDSNPWFDLVVNCWLPLPGRESHVSTKAIHHHGTINYVFVHPTRREKLLTLLPGTVRTAGETCHPPS